METKAAPQQGASSFNFDNVKELSERFGRLIKQLGSNNRCVRDKDHRIKSESPRYRFEIEFAYALHEIQQCPRYLQGKKFDEASQVVNELINHLKVQRERAEKEDLKKAA